MPKGAKYLLVLDDANYMMLDGGQSIPTPVSIPSAHIFDVVERMTAHLKRAYLMPGTGGSDRDTFDGRLHSTDDYFEGKQFSTGGDAGPDCIRTPSGAHP